jgi:calcineurin-like phosphoesterase family protein
MMDKAKIFFTADWHLGHSNVIKYCGRPFSGVAEMGCVIKENWNQVVTPDSTVYILGDCALNPNWAMRMFPELNGTKILIAGNHDKLVDRGNGNLLPKQVAKFLAAGVAEVHRELKLELELLGKHWVVKLAHLPYAPISDEEKLVDDRFIHLRPQPTGERLLLCAHVHEKWLKRRNMINMGVDRWEFKPVSILDLEKLLETADENN